MNEECLVGRCHHHLPTTSMSFVHTARHFYRLGIQLSYLDTVRCLHLTVEISRGLISRGRTSRNKVAVGEPAAGSLSQVILNQCNYYILNHFNEYFCESISYQTSITYIGGCLGSCIDEERSEQRNVL